jgi:hypothetical protein
VAHWICHFGRDLFSGSVVIGKDTQVLLGALYCTTRCDLCGWSMQFVPVIFSRSVLGIWVHGNKVFWAPWDLRICLIRAKLVEVRVYLL